MNLRHGAALTSPKPNIILDKSYLQGSSPQRVEQLCGDCRTLLPDVLFYELFLAPSYMRAACFRKLPHDRNVIAVVTGVGDLFKFELISRAPCTPLDKRFVKSLKLNNSLFNPTSKLTPEQTHYLNSKETDLDRQTLGTIGIWRSVDQFFPELKGLKPGGNDAAVQEARLAIASDTKAVRQIYEGIRQEWKVPIGFPNELPPATVIGPNWAVYRWLQVNLLAAIDVVSKYAGEIVPNAEKRTNERHDLDYTVTALLIGGLATKDRAMADRFRLLCPGGLLVS